MGIRVACFIDGLNLYHAISRLGNPDPYDVNLWSLALQFIDPKKETLESVHYFYAPLKRQKGAHMRYVGRLIQEEVTAVPGFFNKTKEKCSQCGSVNKSYVEKQSDVNLALTIFKLAVEDQYDRALVVTNDTDIAPALSQTLASFPEKKITVLTPPGASTASCLSRVASTCEKIFQKHLSNSIFDDSTSS